MDLEQCCFRIIPVTDMNVYNKLLIGILFCPEQLVFFPSFLVYFDVKHFQIDRSDIWIYYFKDFCLIVIRVPQISLFQ